MKLYRTDSQLKRQVRFHNGAVNDRGHVIFTARCSICGHLLTADSATDMNVLRAQHREKHRWIEEE